MKSHVGKYGIDLNKLPIDGGFGLDELTGITGTGIKIGPAAVITGTHAYKAVLPTDLGMSEVVYTP